MSKLQELKNKLSPNGIEYKKLRETCIIKSGEFASPKELSKIQDDLHIYPCYGSNGLRGYINKFNYDGEYPIVGRVGACGSVNYINGKYFITDNAFIVKSKKNEYIPKFLYYLLKSLNLNKYKLGGAQPAIAGKTIYDLSAPIPPLEVQEEIVRILDPLTKDANELIDLLKREQELRKKQYAYYRDKLLTFETDIQYKNLSDICSFIYGYTEKAKDEGNARFVRITDILETGCLNPEGAKYINLTSECEKYLLKKGDLLTARAGATYGKTLYFDEDYPAVYASYLIKLNLDNNLILNRYYWHFAKSSYYWKQANKLAVGGAQPNLNANSLAKIIVPLPPLEKQKEIVSILDNLEKYYNKLQESLTVEIEKRKKQYEFYRDKLLTFEKI